MSLSPEQLAKLSPERRILLQRMLRERAAAAGDPDPDGPPEDEGSPEPLSVEDKRRLLVEKLRQKKNARSPVFPLSFAQQRLWFLDRLEPGSAAYNVPAALRLRGPLNVRALERSLGEVVRRHEALRTVFHATDEGAVAEVLAPAPSPIPVVELAGLPEPEREAEVRLRLREEATRPFDLSRGPLLRAALLRLGEGEWVLCFTMHHVVSDAWSMGVLVREVSRLYAGFTEGGDAALPELPMQYGDYAVWQRAWLRGERLERQVAYWRERLAGASATLELPTDRPLPARPSARAAYHTLEVPAEVAAPLRVLAREEGASPFMTLLAGWQALLGRWSGEDDVSVGTPVAGRTRREVEELIGCFVNTLVVRTDLSGAPSLRELLVRVREGVLEAQAHQDVPFEKLVEELHPERDLHGTPFFRVMFTYTAADGDQLRLGEVTAEGVGVALETAKFDLSLAVKENGDHFSATLTYRTELWEAETAERMLRGYGRVLAAVAADPSMRVPAVELLGDEERRLLLEEWSATGGPLSPSDRCVHELFAEQAARTPDAVALVSGPETLTYAELDRRADALAAMLRERGAGPETRVGVCLEWSPELVAAMLATFKAGGVYVPLDPSYPAERLAYMLEDSGARVLVTDGGAGEWVTGFGGEVVRVGTPHPRPLPHKGGGEHDRVGARPEEALTPRPPLPMLGEGENNEGTSTLSQNWERVASLSEPGEGPPEPTHAQVSPANLAYVVYTSGSTGTPKGVAVEHRAAAAHLRAMARALEIGPADRVLQFASASFDVSLEQVLLPLLHGAALVLRGPEPWAPAEWAARAEALGVTVANFPPAFWRTAVEEGTGAPGGLRLLVLGGDVLPAAAVPRWRERAGGGVRLVNAYGPTETVVTATVYEVPEGFPGELGGTVAPVGRPLAGRRAYVLDAGGLPAAVGVPGELHLGGLLARGYAGRAEATAERFVPDPFSGEAGARLYRTGDRVRWLAGGVLEFLGRTDQQVKVRGFRIEPGEVEAHLLAMEEVRDAAVAARGDGAGERRLVAYLAAAPGAALPGADELRSRLRERLPEHMVPSAFVALDALPLTPAGKLDRRALPAPERAEGDAYVAPRNPTEETLAGVWAEVLGAERVGVEDDFFELGGHSLLATKVVSRVRDALGVEIPLRAVFEAHTVARLAERVASAPRPLPVEEKRRLLAEKLRQKKERRPSVFPLSFAQQRLWFLDQLEPGSAAYNVPVALRLHGPLDVRALQRALTEVVRRHEALRTVLRAADGGTVAEVQPPVPVVIPTVELAGLPEPEREAAMRSHVHQETTRPFDLSRGPLLRAALLRLGESEWVLCFTMHHVVSDGWSMEVLVREASEAYGAFSEGREPVLPPLAMQYGDYAVWQRAWLRGETLERQVAYWRERLAGAATLELPTDHPRAASRSARAGYATVEVPAEVAGRLRALARAEGASPFMTLLAAWQALLGRWSGEDDVLVGTPVAGRTRREVEELIGFFVNTLVVRTDLSGAPGFRELLRRVRDGVLEAQSHQDVPFEKLVEELHPERDLHGTPFFRVMFTYTAADGESLRLGEVEMEMLEAPLETAKFDLSLAVVRDRDLLVAKLTYRAELWDARTAERMLEHFVALLDAAAAHPDTPLARLPLLPAAERERVLEGLNDTRRDYPAGLRVHDLLAAQARRTPDAPALSFRGEAVSYAELDRRANRLANRLRRLGVGPETRVGVCLERTPELVVALLAVLGAGGAYVPLDPAYPRERLGYMQEDARVSLVLTSTALAGVLPQGARTLALDAARAEIEAEPDAAPESGVLPENLSHVIFTSGSTGRPKGVMIRHASTVVLLHWLRESVSDEERASVLFSTSINFDVSVAEVFGTLAWGGKLVLVENALELASVEEPVVYASMVPTAAAELLRTGAIPASVRTLNLGGEPLPADLARALYAAGVDRVGNLYGPTEDTTYSTYSVVERGGAQVFVGRPVANTRALVLDGELQPVPLGVVGELYLAGDGLARGYASRPDLTADRFLPDPFGPAGSRMYRVMDRVRWTAAGELEYFGRTDFQVKVRGFRIEPGEIETVLRGVPGVREAVAIVREDAPGDRRLVAYVTGEEGAEAPASEELRAHLREHVPEYMVPSAFVELETLPLTPNGKVDRRALPAPEGSSAEAYVAPSTPTEEVLAGIWAEVLGAERVGVHADFFELGGHSLLATRIVSRVRESFGVEIPLRALFEAPTVAALAECVQALLPPEPGEVRHSEQGIAGQLAGLSPEKRLLLEKILRDRAHGRDEIRPVPREGEIPLSFAQQRLWFIDQLQPGSAAYNVPSALRVRGPLDAAALEAAFGGLEGRHEALRTTFASAGGRPVQVVRPAGGRVLRTVDLGALPEAAREAEMRRLAAAHAAAPFDLAAGPLLRVSLVRLEDREHALLVNMHHIVSDAWSIDVMVREVAELYDAAREGCPPRLPPLPVQYADFAAWQRGWLQGEELERQLAWWRERLAGAATLELPTDRPRPRVAGSAGRTVQLRLPRETGVALRALSRSEGATPFMTLMAAWQALLGRHAGQEDVSVGTPIAGRNRKEIEGLIGFFVNTLVIRADLSGRPDARELVRRVRATTLGAYQQQDIPFEKLVDEMGVERSLSHSPLFQALFAMRTVEGGGPRLGGAVLERVSTGGTTAKFDLTLSVSDDGRDMGGSLEFRTDLFDPGTAERLAERFVVLLRGMTGSPETPVASLPLMAEGERQRVLAEWNDTGAEAPPSGGGALHERFEAQARRTPDAVAVEGGGERVTYAELDARSGRLARRLRARGVGPESRVGVWLERTPELVVALLAALKAGAAYVPLEMSYPPDRIAFMLEDAGVSVLLTQERLLGRLPAHAAEAVFVDAAEAGAEDPLPPPEVSPGSLAYLIYTSGSTGRPKGVAMPQRPLLQLLDWQARDWSGPAAARTLQFAAASFDVSFQEIFSTLLSGGTLLLVPEELRTDLPGLARHLDEARVERLFLPFVALQHLAKTAEEQGIAPAALREVVTAGEQLQVTESIREWLGRIPGCVLVNQYGPSETHVATSHTLPGRAEEWPALPPIGRPIAGTRCYVLDGELEPVPIGVPGELYLGGAGVARGYHGRAELTAERFVPDPFGGEPGARTYRTGDRARWLADGTLEFLGRTDQQAKIRGFRVEPGEVETALRAHPGLRDAVVAVREDTPGNRRLVAYLVAHPGAEPPKTAALRTFLRARLPEYMVPAAFVPLEALPTTPSGKTDRAALPAPDRRAAGEEYVAPRNPTEEALAAVWAEVLGIERVGANDNFFDLGGHSLLLVQLHSRLRERLAPELTVADLFGVRTLADLARQIDEAREAAEQAGADASPREDAQPRAGALRARRGRERALRAPREDEDDAGDE